MPKIMKILIMRRIVERKKLTKGIHVYWILSLYVYSPYEGKQGKEYKDTKDFSPMINDFEDRKRSSSKRFYPEVISNAYNCTYNSEL